MKKANVEKIETMMADYLQYRYRLYLRFDATRENKEIKNPDLVYYEGACSMIEACGGTWRRHFKGDANKQEDLDNPDLYSHTVNLPSDTACERLNEDAWK